MSPAPGTPDDQVATALRGVRAAIQTAISEQSKDPDKQDPADAKVSAALGDLLAAVNAAITAQAADTDTTAVPEPKPPAPDAKLPSPISAAPPAAPPDSPTNTVVSATATPSTGFTVTSADRIVATITRLAAAAYIDALTAAAPPAPAPAKTPATGSTDDGGVDPNATCARPDCGHRASVHGNTDLGEYTGACSTPGCECEEFLGATATAQADQPDDTDSNGADGLPEPDSNEFAAGDLVEAVEVEPPPNAPPAVEPTAAMGARFKGVLIIEGQPTGDGRMIAVDALTWREPPLPLMGLATATHDPAGFDLNDPSVMCGIIDTLTKTPGEGDTQLVEIGGNFLANDDGSYFADLVAQLGRMGISGDVAVEETSIEVTEVDDIGFPTGMDETMTAGRVMGGTLCPFPAFEGAYVCLDTGDGEIPDAQAIPQSTATADAPPDAVLAGGQLVHLMTYEECGECDLGLDVVTAASAPSAPPAAWFADPAFSDKDERLSEILSRDGRRENAYACPLTVTADGRVYGHIAPWGVCHTGISGQCITAPPSRADYAHFKRGQVITAEGDRIRVGVLTAGAGHANRTVGPLDAMAHYDNTALQVAHVNIGEDDYGIWVAGSVAPGATQEQVATLRASAISGDWRKLGGQLELVAALAVNNPGFPVSVVASGGPTSLVAAGAQTMALLKTPAAPEPETPAAAPTVFERAFAPLLEDARGRVRERMAALRG